MHTVFFLQAGELDVLCATLRWGEHQLIKRMEERGEFFVLFLHPAFCLFLHPALSQLATTSVADKRPFVFFFPHLIQCQMVLTDKNVTILMVGQNYR